MRPRGSLSSRRRVATGIVLVIVGAAISLLRQRAPGALETLWAEDGSIFLQDALADSHPRVWLKGYAGYMHLAPRVLATLAVSLPIEWAPLVMSGGAALVVSCLVLLVFRLSMTRIPGGRDRLVLAICMLASSPAGIEAANSAANIHWFLLYAIAWVVVCPPVGVLQTTISSVVLFTAATSNPFAAFAVPILGWRVVRERRTADFVCLAVSAVGVALQGFVVLSAGGSRPLDPLATPVATLARWYGFYVVETAAFGVSLRDWLVSRIGVVGSAALAVALLAYMITPAVRAAMTKPGVPFSFAFLHGAFYFLPVALAQTSTPRYAIAPVLLVYATIAWGVGQDPAQGNALRKRVGLAIIAALTALDFSPRNARSDGIVWPEELSTARLACASRSLEYVTLRIPPRNLPANDPRAVDGYWSLRVPCGEILASQARTPSR